jgi:GT2 family glycosyltransferase
VAVMAGRRGTFVLSQFHASGEGGAEETGTHADLARLHFAIADSPDQINCLATQGLFAHWQDVRTVGGFHPRLLPHYLSDYEYTIRAHRLGFKCETSPELLIDLNRETTGFHTIEEPSFAVFLRKFFSLKSPANPIYFSTFVWLACPKSMVIPNLFRVWRHAARTMARAFVRSLTPMTRS